MALNVLAGQGLQISVLWRPFRLNPEMPPGGLPRVDYRRAKFGSLERSQQLDSQVATAARAAGVRINHDRIARTPNTLAAHRLIRLAGLEGRQDALVGRLFKDYFVDGRDIGDDSVLADAAAAVGMDRAVAHAYLVGDASRAEVEQEDAAVRRAGLQGGAGLRYPQPCPVCGRRSGRCPRRRAGPRLRRPTASIAPPGEM